MGVYLNPGAALFRRGRSSRIYVDKSQLIAYLNAVVNTERAYVCVSRPRRFGKSMAANMVSAYFDRTVDGTSEFEGLAISRDPSFTSNLGRFDVIKLNMQDFLSATHDIAGMIERMNAAVCRELVEAYPQVRLFDPGSLAQTLSDIFAQTQSQFVVVIDEWDCVMREHQADIAGQKDYLDFLRALLKDKPYVALCYMTGILPIKKYGSHSALNMFDEFSMTEPDEMAPYMGFTEAEVRELCGQWHRDFSECSAWYDGYVLDGVGSAYNPQSVVRAMETVRFGSYWTKTETYEALRRYIDLNMGGLREKVIMLMGGAHVAVDTSTYANDMTTLSCADDVLTLLVHLGYLAYDQTRGEVLIPNREVMGEYASSIAKGGWDEVARTVAASDDLLEALLAKDGDAVALGVARAHEDAASIIAYSDENSLACTLRLAFFSAVRQYRLVREAPAGKGYADLLMIPLASAPAAPGIVVELKWGAGPHEAIAQIRERGYDRALSGTGGEGRILLAGITYDPKSKTHACVVEEA